MQKTNSLLETERSSSVVVQLVFRILNGLAAGFSGFLIMFLLWTISTPVFGPILGGEVGANSPVFHLLVLVLVFLSTFGASIVNTFMTCLTLKDEYKRMRVSLYHTFLFNILFFIGFIVLYFLSVSISLEAASYVVLAYVFSAAIGSAILNEIFGPIENILLRVYEIIMGALFGFFIVSMVFSIDGSVIPLIIVGLPALFLCINLGIGLIDTFYYWLYKGYGIDFLSIRVSDLENEEASEPKVEVSKDVTGSDFISK